MRKSACYLVFNPSFIRGFEYVCKRTKNKKRQCEYCPRERYTCEHLGFSPNGFNCRKIEARREAAEEAHRISGDEIIRQDRYTGPTGGI